MPGPASIPTDRPHLRVVEGGGRPVQPDPAVVAAAQGGDRAAAGRVLAHLLPVVRAVVRGVVRDGSRADDVVQETLLAVLDALPRFAGRSSLRSWVRTIAVRTAMRHVRRTRRRQEVEVSADADAVGAAMQALPCEALPRPVEAYLSLLPRAQREAVVMRHVLGYSVPEIAERLGVSENTVKSRLLYGRRTLRRHVRRDLRVGVRRTETEHRP